jgi:hypothetical protein
MSKPIIWNGGEVTPDDYDLCTRRASGYWDVVHGVDGWVVYSPVYLDGSHATETGTFRLVLGDVKRDDAREVAEAGIRKTEGWQV